MSKIPHPRRNQNADANTQDCVSGSDEELRALAIVLAHAAAREWFDVQSIPTDSTEGSSDE